jgi:phosphocarrier protein FPr
MSLYAKHFIAVIDNQNVIDYILIVNQQRRKNMVNLDSRSIVLGVEVAGKREAIERVGEVLVQNGNIDKGYIDSMKGRESVANTFLGNGISIPHGLPEHRDLIHRTGIAVLQIPRGVSWNPGETVFLVIGIAAKSDEHITILTNLTHVLDDPDTIARLSRTTDTGDIARVLSGEVSPSQKNAPVMDLSGFSSIDVVITCEHGFHARPATFFVDVASGYESEVYVEYDGRTGNGKSLASLLKLGVKLRSIRDLAMKRRRIKPHPSRNLSIAGLLKVSAERCAASSLRPGLHPARSGSMSMSGLLLKQTPKTLNMNCWRYTRRLLRRKPTSGTCTRKSGPKQGHKMPVSFLPISLFWTTLSSGPR